MPVAYDDDRAPQPAQEIAEMPSVHKMPPPFTCPRCQATLAYVPPLDATQLRLEGENYTLEGAVKILRTACQEAYDMLSREYGDDKALAMMERLKKAMDEAVVPA